MEQQGPQSSEEQVTRRPFLQLAWALFLLSWLPLFARTDGQPSPVIKLCVLFGIQIGSLIGAILLGRRAANNCEPTTIQRRAAKIVVVLSWATLVLWCLVLIISFIGFFSYASR